MLYSFFVLFIFVYFSDRFKTYDLPAFYQKGHKDVRILDTTLGFADLIMDRTILHVDFDSFFASCEQHFNPNLRGVSIGVTAENGRNCIIAASREAKAKGIKSPSTTWEAKRIYPDIIFVKADFERYLEITKKLIQIATSFSPLVEVFSLDEVFVDLTPVTHLYSADHVVNEFKNKLREEVGPTITVSAGVSYNKLLAKLATSLNKPDGYARIDKSNKDKVFSQIKLNEIMGIGERYKRRLNFLGIFTFKELQNYPLYLLKKEFGRSAAENIKRISMGIDDSPVLSYMEDVVTKSVGRNYCLPQNEYDQKKILENIYELSEEIALKLRRLNMKGRTVGLYLTGEQSMGGRKTVSRHINLGEEIFEICQMLYKKWDWNYMVRQMSVWVTNLTDEQYTTMSMFENPNKEVTAKVVDKINDRFGHHTIRNGYLTNAPKLHTKPNGYLADKWQRKELANI